VPIQEVGRDRAKKNTTLDNTIKLKISGGNNAHDSLSGKWSIIAFIPILLF
jgi:hypothetical protein